MTSSCLSIFYFTKRNLISRTFIYSITRKSFFKYNLKIIENVIHIMAILFLKFSQMSFSEWGGWGLEYHKDTQQCLQALCPWENHLHWRNLGPERHFFHKVRVSCVCLLVDILKTASLPIAENICFLFTGSESFSKCLVTAVSYLLIETKEVLIFNW